MNILGPSVGYTDLLDYEIAEKIKEEDDAKFRGDKKTNPLRPSSAGYCGRRLAYELNEYRGKATYPREAMQPAMWRLLKLGHAVEREVIQSLGLLKFLQRRYSQQILTFFPLERGIESPLEYVEGSCDGVLWSEKHKAVYDVKSKKDKFSYAFKTQWDESLDDFDNSPNLIKLSATAYYADDLMAFIEELGDDFFADNLYQLNLYAMNDFLKSRGVDHAFIFRYCKNDSRHLEIRFRPSEEAFEIVKNKFNTVSVCVDKNEIEKVERDFTLGSIRCAFCPFSKECWGGDTNATKEWFKTFPQKRWPSALVSGDGLLALMERFEALETIEEDKAKLEAEIQKELIKRELYFFKTPEGHIYKLQKLKSPKPHYELRRTKL